MRSILSIEIRVFFFQAEDGIRDYKVTGVQTCALPISAGRRDGQSDGSHGGAQAAVESSARTDGRRPAQRRTDRMPGADLVALTQAMPSRTEERRGGEEGKSRGAPGH